MFVYDQSSRTHCEQTQMLKREEKNVHHKTVTSATNQRHVTSVQISCQRLLDMTHISKHDSYFCQRCNAQQNNSRSNETKQKTLSPINLQIFAQCRAMSLDTGDRIVNNARGKRCSANTCHRTTSPNKQIDRLCDVTHRCASIQSQAISP